MAKRATMTIGAVKSKKRGTREAWSKQHLTELKKHSKLKTPVEAVAKAMKRSAGALRQKAYAVGMPLGSSQVADATPVGLSWRQLRPPGASLLWLENWCAGSGSARAAHQLDYSRTIKS
jgi:hypothetical protein